MTAERPTIHKAGTVVGVPGLERRGQLPPITAPDQQPHRGPRRVGGIRRRAMVAALTVTTALAGLGIWRMNQNQGGGGVAPSEGPTPTDTFKPSSTPDASLKATLPPATAEPIPTEQPTPIPTPEITPIPAGYSEQNGNIVYITEQGEVLNVPHIPGLRAVRQDTKIVYVAEKSNTFGLAENAYAGEHKPNVTVESKATGGVVLTGPVVDKLIKNKLATIPNKKDKWTIALPVDIRGEDNANNVTISFSNLLLPNITPIPTVLINFEGTLPLANIIPNNRGYIFLVQRVTAPLEWGFADKGTFGTPFTDNSDPINFIKVVGKTPAPGVTTDILTDNPTPIGSKIANITGDAQVYLGGGRDNKYYNVTADRILTVGENNTLVFTAAG